MPEGKSNTLYIEDCEHDLNYQGDKLTEQLHPQHSYRATQITVDQYDQKCDVCRRKEQAQFRVTFQNLTTGVTLYMGRRCLRKQFGVTEGELRHSTVLLTRLARAWEAYLQAVGGRTPPFAQTSEAVQHMHLAFRRTNERLPLYRPAADAIKRILENLAHINSYRPDVVTLIHILALLHELTRYPNVFRVRGEALRGHPHFDREQRENAYLLFATEDVTWARVKRLGEDLQAVRRKPLPVRITAFPAHDFSIEGEYHEALRDYAKQRVTELTEKDEPLPIATFQDRLRADAAHLKKRSGFVELVFESRDQRRVDREAPRRPLGDSMEANGIFIVRSDVRSYMKKPRQETYSSIEAMQRANQQLTEGDGTQPQEAKPFEVFYRAFVLWKPDPFYPAYATWNQHGGVSKARERLEDLLSEFPLAL